MKQDYESKVRVIFYTFKDIKDYRETRENVESLLNLYSDEDEREKVKSFKGIKSTSGEGILLTIGAGKMSISGESYEKINSFRKEIINEDISVIEEKVLLSKDGFRRELESFFYF